MVDDGRKLEQNSILREGPYVRFWLARAASTLSFQMAAVAVGWQVYDLTRSTFALGLAGLLQFLPILLLTLIVGYGADRFNRKMIMVLCQVVSGLTVCGLALGSSLHHLNMVEIYSAVILIGTARAFERPSTLALLPSLVEPTRVAQAIATSSSATQAAAILGPAIGGLLYAFGTPVAYTACAILFTVAARLTSTIVPLRNTRTWEEVTITSVFAGIHYIRKRGKVLGAISLDLFVVVLGGATALLPAYARNILHTGPWGLSLLRLSPAMGALAVCVYLAHYPMRRRAGYQMFAGVIVFGLATIGFALSRNFVLSMCILFILGGADVISVVVRSSLVQLETPDHMRGRVSAVNSLFIGTSNQLGQFESGVTASWWGIVPATILGGMGSIGIALVWMWLFPSLKKLDNVNSVMANDAIQRGDEGIHG